MTPKAQRIAIAEAVGYVRTQATALATWQPPSGGWPITAAHLPDFLNDLNAMHQVEETIPTIKLAAYAKALGRDYRDQPPILWPSLFTFIHATASQRAEAFLRTIGKWKD